MMRPFIFVLVCCLSIFACKNETSTNAESDSPSNSLSKTSSTDQNSSQPKSPESIVREGICGVMVESVNLKDGNLDIQYFKNAAEFKKVRNNPKMNAEVFKRYWATASRAEKVMALIPSQILHEHAAIKQVNITLYTPDKTLTASIDRDKLAQFSGRSWKELNNHWKNKSRDGVAQDKTKRKAFYDQFVTEQ